MEPGAFSISLAVKDIVASRDFYEKFGFKVVMGDASKHWLILKNGLRAIGLFQGMFERNSLAFNPGEDSNATKLTTFTDVRDLQRELKAKGAQLTFPGWVRHRPDFRDGPWEKAAIATSTIALARILIEPSLLWKNRQHNGIHRSGIIP